MENRCEKSIIDVVIVCDKVRPYITKFIVDEQKLYALSNYSKKKISYSDHNSLIGYMELKIQKFKTERKTIFNYRNAESQEVFKNLTKNDNALINIFLDKSPFPKQVQLWWKKIKKFIHSAFKKVRVQKRVPKGCKKFKNRIKGIKQNNYPTKEKAENLLRNYQHLININKIKKNMSILKKSKNSQMSIWDIKKLFFPKIKPQFPVAKRNIFGKIITNPNQIQNIYLEHFIFRMRKRPILPGLENYQKEVEVNFQKVLNSTKNILFPDWTMTDLERVLRTLKGTMTEKTKF